MDSRLMAMATTATTCFICKIITSYNTIITISIYAPSCISPSKYKPPKLVTQKNPPINSPFQIKAPGGLYSEIALVFKIKQSKNCTVTHKNFECAKETLGVPNDCSQKV